MIVDDFSRYSWVFFMKTKDEAFEFVRDLILRLKNELPQAMRAIRSDNGTEFKNARFDAFCSDQGLEHQYSSPYTPQQNGVVQRKNRTLVEMARTMLDEHRTSRKYWAEAVNTACYVSNRISCVLSCTRLLMSCDLDASPVLTISEFSVAGVLC